MVAGGLSYAVKIDWMSEMKVVENSFKAEYGSNVRDHAGTTKSGTKISVHLGISRQSALAAGSFTIKKTPLNVMILEQRWAGRSLKTTLFLFLLHVCAAHFLSPP